jgi:hypothetical protein
MKHLDLSPIRHTSVTLRSVTRASLKQASQLLRASNIPFSEQRVMRECLRFALKMWRGRREIAQRNKRYNLRQGPYEIVPFYTTEALRAVAWTRCHHSGISLSRLMDFAVTCYLSRVLEYWLRFQYSDRGEDDLDYWRKRYELRLHPSDFIISYKASTEKNDGTVLDFAEKTEILPWPPPKTQIL